LTQTARPETLSGAQPTAANRAERAK